MNKHSSHRHINTEKSLVVAIEEQVGEMGEVGEEIKRYKLVIKK